jgi:hypothetical protein
MLLLKDLYELGFRYLGMEMLWDKEINRRKFAIHKSGFYTREPNSSNLIKEAVAMGYTIFGYDDFTKDREKKQAENIFNNTFGIDSSAKVLILAGFEHIDKKVGNSMKMAAEFINMYNIEPLTINQATYKFKTNDWLSIIDTVYIPSPKKFLADIIVSNNLTYNIFAKIHNYAQYSVNISDSILNIINNPHIKGDYIISICRTTDYKIDHTAIPVFNYLIKKPLSNEIYLPLPQDDYIFLIKNNYNELIFKGRKAK